MFIWFITFVCLVYMMNMLVITRVHYTIDIGAGLLFACFFYKLCCDYVCWIDKFISIPYLIGKKVQEKVKNIKIRRAENTMEVDEC